MTRGRVVAAWIAVVKRRWPWGLGVGAVVVGLAAALLLTARPVYRAEARLRLGEAPPAPGVSPGGNVLGLFRMGGDPFYNDIELLESRTMGEQLVEHAALNVALVAPKGWHRDSLFTAVRTERGTARGSYTLVWEGDGAVTVRRAAPTDSAVGRFGPGEPIRFGGVELVPGRRRAGAPAEIGVEVYPFEDAARSAQIGLDVERTRREANVLLIRYEHTDPQVAQQVVQSAIDEFLAFRTELFARESGETVDSLRGVAERTRAELAASEAALAQLQTSSFLIAPEAQSEAAVERLVAAEVELERARQELAAIEGMLARMEADAGGSAWTSLAALPSLLENETLGSLLTRLSLLEQERTGLAARRGPGSLEIRTLEEQMAVLEGTLTATASSYRVGLAERVAALDATVRATRAQLAGLPDQALELARRQRETRLLGELVILTEQRLRQEELREALTFSNIQIIDAAQVASRPVWPRKKLGLAVALVIALGCAVLAMAVVESADGTVRSAAELSTLAGAPVLAALAVNGRVVQPAASDAVALLTVGGGPPGTLPPLIVVPVDSNGSGEAADAVHAALASGAWEVPSRDVRVCAAVTSYASARAALAQGGPVLLAVVRGRTALPDVERAVRLLREAGGSAAGMVVVVRSEREVGELWA